jgi:hypothetical protein
MNTIELQWNGGVFILRIFAKENKWNAIFDLDLRVINVNVMINWQYI